RRSDGQAYAQKAKEARWRYLARNPRFRSELATLSDTHGDESYGVNLEAFLKRWGFNLIGDELILTFGVAKDRMSADEITEFLEAFGSSALSWAVVARESDDDTKLLLEIDLRHPLDALEALISAELREAVGDKAKQRRRLDKVDFYLAV